MATKINPVTETKAVAALKKAATGEDTKVRMIYSDYKKANAAFKAAAELATANGLPSYSAPKDTFAPGFSACVALVGSKDPDTATGKRVQGIKAVLLFPLPTMEAFLGLESLPEDANAEALRWMRKITEKEAAHVAFRSVRECDTVEEFEAMAATIPTDINAYVIAHERGGDGIDLTAFNAVWTEFRAALKEQMPALVEALPSKQEVIKAIRSAPYALRTYEGLEKRGVFLFLGKKLIEACESNEDETGNAAPIDASSIEEIIADRAEADPYKAVDYSKLDNLDLGIA
jgi:hypothetical protein